MYWNFGFSMGRNGIDSSWKLAKIELIPAGTEVIVANRTDLFRNKSMLSLHCKTDVGYHLLRDRTC